MSFRNRPVLNRKHRPRWQDELRSQQLIVIGFATAISVAIGIFAATAWNDYYATHLRQIAYVGGVPITRSDLTLRMNIMGSELQASGVEISGRIGGVRDSIIEQQLQAIDQELQALVQRATDSLTDGAVLDAQAPGLGIAVSEADLDAEIADRRTLPTILQLRLLLVAALPDDAEPGSEPTEEDWAAAERAATEFVEQLNGGADFAELATNESADPSASGGGLLGWVEEEDTSYGDYFRAVRYAEAGTIAGPTRGTTGYWIVRLEDRRNTKPDDVLSSLLASAGVTDAQYRDLVHDQMLRQAFRDYFSETLLATYLPQRHVSQIFIGADQGIPVPKQRVRHYLAQPIPGAEDQSTATEEQWAASLARAEAFRVAASAPDADWFELAADSDDPGSRSKGGDLGWYDPASGGFVPEFSEALAGLSVGELSPPVRTDFGYHIIQITDTRTTAAEQVDEIVAAVRADPDSFADVARRDSEDVASAQDGGDIGWVIPYQFELERSRAIFALTEPDQISDPVATTNGFYIYKLDETSDARYVLEAQRNQVAGTGFQRWLDEMRSNAHIWLDPDFDLAAAS